MVAQTQKLIIMQTFQFTCLVDQNYPVQVLTLARYAEPLERLPHRYISPADEDICVENVEGVYQHGKVNAVSEEEAKNKLKSFWI